MNLSIWPCFHCTLISTKHTHTSRANKPWRKEWLLTLKALNFWKFTSYCSLKPLWSGMGEVVPARISPTLHPPSPPTVHQLSRLALKELSRRSTYTGGSSSFMKSICPGGYSATRFSCVLSLAWMASSKLSCIHTLIYELMLNVIHVNAISLGQGQKAVA